MAKKSEHPWSKDALLAKSQRFFDEMLRHTRDEWQYALWSALALELLARAALAKVSPTLLADAKDWNHIYFALEKNPKEPKYVPKSIGIADVFNRIGATVDGVTPDMVKFGALHMNRRNEDLHSGAVTLEPLSTSQWQPAYFELCKALASHLGKKLDTLIGEDEAAAAEKMIKAFRDDSAKAIQKSIAAHKNAWEKLSCKDREDFAAQAVVWATSYKGHRVKCPSCESNSLVTGEPITAAVRELDDDTVTEKQDILPTSFECVACKLKIDGFAHLNACGLGNVFTSTSVMSVADLYEASNPLDGYEDDNNEYFTGE